MDKKHLDLPVWGTGIEWVTPCCKIYKTQNVLDRGDWKDEDINPHLQNAEVSFWQE
jgi:hypothetical protein